MRSAKTRSAARRLRGAATAYASALAALTDSSEIDSEAEVLLAKADDLLEDAAIAFARCVQEDAR
jgi:hypothetical protein